MLLRLFEEKKLFFLSILLAILITFCDLYSKYLIFTFLDNLQYPYFEITSFFNLVKVWNRGVSFGMLNNLNNGKYIILSINIIILIILLIWLYRTSIIYLSVAISLIIGGAMGNIIDRIKNDAVADFLDFHIMGYHWPAFNLADSVVFIGVCLLLLENYFVKKPNE